LGQVATLLGNTPVGHDYGHRYQLSVSNGTKAGLLFAVGSMIVEVIIVRTALVTMKWLARQHRLFHLLEYVTTSVILFLSVASFVAAYKMTGFTTSLPATSITPFWTGAFLSLTNPLHIPFWLGWSTVLMNKNILSPNALEYNWYVTGIGLGTMIGFAVFVYTGKILVAEIQQHQTFLNCIIGVVLLATAVLQVKKMIEVPVSVRYKRLN
jgi:threonine/homoserine/homoserine lactone efflux protein